MSEQSEQPEQQEDQPASFDWERYCAEPDKAKRLNMAINYARSSSPWIFAYHVLTNLNIPTSADSNSPVDLSSDAHSGDKVPVGNVESESRFPEFYENFFTWYTISWVILRARNMSKTGSAQTEVQNLNITEKNFWDDFVQNLHIDTTQKDIEYILQRIRQKGLAGQLIIFDPSRIVSDAKRMFLEAKFKNTGSIAFFQKEDKVIFIDTRNFFSDMTAYDFLRIFSHELSHDFLESNKPIDYPFDDSHHVFHEFFAILEDLRLINVVCEGSFSSQCLHAYDTLRNAASNKVVEGVIPGSCMRLAVRDDEGLNVLIQAYRHALDSLRISMMHSLQSKYQEVMLDSNLSPEERDKIVFGLFEAMSRLLQNNGNSVAAGMDWTTKDS
ncbi:MAG: hypothetical protein N3A54_03115 [Patescibacteria group bacterium]|nr:hypothetical protein [Patescibacteria group bacterium]